MEGALYFILPSLIQRIKYGNYRMDINVFALLHINENEQTGVNLRVKDFSKRISVYVNNAIVLSKTLSEKEIKFSLLTNNRAAIKDCILTPGDSSHLKIIEIPFITKVPSGIRFYSAHYKLDAFRYMASLSNCYSALCDLDMICINDIPPCLHHIVSAKIPLCYDISDQVIPTYGSDVIIKDLSTINGVKSEGRWSGGEFISGTSTFFGKLVREIDGLYNKYISNIGSLHHVGDEAFTSAALEKLRRQGVYIGDAGTLGIVGRYWNSNVLHPQKPFNYFKNCFLLHLPSDKKFLSSLAKRDMDDLCEIKIIYAKYRNSVSQKMSRGTRLIIRVLQNIVANKANKTTSADLRSWQ